ncbi:MAG TPA: cytochrome c biogenesis protein [Kofleriaceae bacterium]|nr:cytochrome c biogenesis protein [Kofleriaceae bacterium]
MKNPLAPIFAVLAAIGFAVTIYLIFYVAPMDRILFFNQKIVYYHVSSAFVLFTTVFVCGIASAGYLKKRDPRWDDVAHAAGELAVVYGAMMLATGMIWGKVAWGHWWRWELRLTTSLILWLTMVGYVIVRRFGGAGGERLAAGLAVFAMVNVPLVYFAVKLSQLLEQVSSHPKAEVVSSLTGAMRTTFWLSVLTFMLMYVAMLLVRSATVATERRARELRERALDAGLFDG